MTVFFKNNMKLKLWTKENNLCIGFEAGLKPRRSQYFVLFNVGVYSSYKFKIHKPNVKKKKKGRSDIKNACEKIISSYKTQSTVRPSFTGLLTCTIPKQVAWQETEVTYTKTKKRAASKFIPHWSLSSEFVKN